MKSITLRLGLSGLLAIVWTAGAAAGSADLRPKFTNGQVTYFRTTTNMVQTMKMGEQPTEMKMIVEIGVRLAVKRVHEDGGADVEYTTLYIYMDGGLPQMPMKFDSRIPKISGGNPMLGGLSAMIDNPIVFSVSASGSIKEVKGIDEAFKSVPPMMSGMFSEETLRQQYGSFCPGRKASSPTKTGATWKDGWKVAMPMAGTLISSVDYTLDRIDAVKNTAAITMKSVTRMEAVKDGAPATFTIKEGKGSGRLIWDLSKGELVRSEGEQRLIMVMAGAPTGQEMTIEQDIKTTTERVALTAFKLKTSGE